MHLSLESLQAAPEGWQDSSTRDKSESPIARRKELKSFCFSNQGEELVYDETFKECTCIQKRKEVINLVTLECEYILTSASLMKCFVFFPFL